MSGVGETSLVMGMISSIISIVDATKQVYEAVEDEIGLPKNFKKSATKLPLISKILEDAEMYIKKVDDDTKDAFKPTLEDCRAQATQLQELFAKVMPEEGDSRWDRYVKAARTIGKGGRVETLVGGILEDLQLLTTRFPEVTTARGKEQLAKAVEEVSSMEPSLPDDFEQMPAYVHYGSGAKNNNTSSGIQHNNSGTGNQNSGSGPQYIGTNHIGTAILVPPNTVVVYVYQSCS
jgi:alkaline phosphatase